jgi:hypothetical protein
MVCLQAAFQAAAASNRGKPKSHPNPSNTGACEIAECR